MQDKSLTKIYEILIDYYTESQFIILGDVIASAIKHPNSYSTFRSILASCINRGFWFLSAGAIYLQYHN